MSRRGIRPEDRERWVFNRLAEAYRARPGYPEQLVERLLVLAGAEGRIADLGAGTGHLAIPLARHGAQVTAVEPARAMLEALAAQAGGLVRLVHSCAEDTSLPSGAFELVLLADALQWVNPELAGREAGRLLAPGGVMAIVEARLEETPFARELAALLARSNPRSKVAAGGAARMVLALATRAAPRSEQLLHEVELDQAALEAVLRSLSYVGPALGPRQLGELLDQAHRLAAFHQGARWRRRLTLSWARLNRRGA